MLWVPAAVGLATALLSGGAFTGLRRLPLLGLTIIILGFAVQLLSLRAAPTASWLPYHAGLIGGGFLELTGFATLWRLPYGKAMFAGVALNLLAMVANGGAMTMTPENAQAAGFHTVTVSGERRTTQGKSVIRPWDQTNLPWLTDFIHVRLPGYEKFFSIGDMILAVSAGAMLFSVIKSEVPVQAPTAEFSTTP